MLLIKSFYSHASNTVRLVTSTCSHAYNDNANMLMFVVVNIHLQSTAEADGYVIGSTSEPDLFTPSKSVTEKSQTLTSWWR